MELSYKNKKLIEEIELSSLQYKEKLFIPKENNGFLLEKNTLYTQINQRISR